MAKVSPKIIVAAIPPNATSKSKGTIPRIVVVAAIKTGRVLEMVASMIESYGEIPLRRCVLISSNNTITFFDNHTQESQPSGDREKAEIEPGK